MTEHRVTAGPYTLELPPNGVAVLYEADGAGDDHQLPGGVGYLEALVQFAGEVIRLKAILEQTRVPATMRHVRAGQPAPMGDSHVILSTEDYERWRLRWKEDRAAIEYVQADCLEANTENALLRVLLKSVRDYQELLRKSTNVGPVTNGPHKEARLLRAMYAAADAAEGIVGHASTISRRPIKADFEDRIAYRRSLGLPKAE